MLETREKKDIGKKIIINRMREGKYNNS